MKFNELGLSLELLGAIEKLGYKEPTQIQEEAIPSIMKGLDVMGESATGSGKTLAFGAGIVDNVKPRQGLQALVLTPTRELAEQIKESIRKFTKSLRVVTIYGGVAIQPQIRDLVSADIAVATPGRMLDHLQRNTVNMSKIKILVLDEADRMLDMGFIDDVARIIKHCPRERQTMFFSATLSTKIKSLGNRFMNNPVIVTAKRHVDPSKLKQAYYNIDKGRKLSLLVNLLESELSGLVMVFCNTRRTTDFVIKNLKLNKIQAVGIHGGLSQNKRTKTIEMFNNAKFGVLVCTDVAARGLHIDNVSHVYNYEIPKDPKDYVHRIGRTARAGEKGKVMNILCEYDFDNFGRVQSEYRNFVIDKMDIPMLKKINLAAMNNNGGERRGGNFRKGNFGRGNFQRGNSSGGSFGRNRTHRSRDDDDRSWQKPRRGASASNAGSPKSWQSSRSEKKVKSWQDNDSWQK
jgi:ATP-dependent RNA helicase DeaD